MSPGATPAATPQTTATTVRVRLFAALREQAGWSTRELALTGATATPQTPQAIWGMLQLGDGGPAGIRVAINHRFAGWEEPLRDGDELAFLPPITGG